MTDRVHIGDVLVTTECENPYRYQGPFMIGHQRQLALVQFRNGTPMSGLVFWFAPAAGGARRLKSPDEVDWRGMR